MKLCAVPLLATLAAVSLCGCYVRKDRSKDNVHVGTPFGSMNVKTDAAQVQSRLGIAVYPGAVPVNEKAHDKNSADVNMDFGSFHLGVVAASFQTSDRPDAVRAFYSKDLARYGNVITCKGHETVGEPAQTSQGLTCKDKDENAHVIHVHADEADTLELRAGSPQHQHIAGLEPKDGGTRIGLVALDLPGSFSFDSKKSDKSEQ